LQQATAADEVHGAPYSAPWSFQGVKWPTFLLVGFALAAFYFSHHYSFLLFHVLVEIFSVIVAFAIFLFAWNTRDKIHNSSLILLGAAYLVIGALDLLHTFSYKGMGVFTTFGADTATQLWVAARYIESFTLLAAPLFASRKLAMPRAIAFYIGLLLLVIATVFVWPVFPTCYVEGQGLTVFKKNSEYLISLVLLASLIVMRRRRMLFDARVFRLLAFSIVFTVVSELMFTFYISVYGISNLVGHLFKLASYWLIYKAIIETGLQQPFTLLFRELAQSEQRYRDLVDRLPSGICEIDADLQITYINPAGRRIIGYDEDDIQTGVNLGMLLDASDHQRAQRRSATLVQGGDIGSTEYRLQRKDGTHADVIVNSVPIFRDGVQHTIQASLTDVTELKRLQTCLQQARKMEAVAVLAGGMAHEVNNVLMGVVGHIELMKFDAAEGCIPESHFVELLDGCERIARLIRQLLAYSRGGRYRSEVIAMKAFMEGVLAELRTQLAPRIQLTYGFPSGLPRIEADPIQLEMVVEGVVNNAAEAIQASGRIHLDLQSREIDALDARDKPGMRPGRYICLKVQDDGQGMNAETLQHIFEPFYTSKFPGRGLGMAAAYGVVKNHGGWVGVDSAPGKGTTVCIYLPVSPERSQDRNSLTDAE
jgi:PAS domain S-box-containing protein